MQTYHILIFILIKLFANLFEWYLPLLPTVEHRRTLLHSLGKTLGIRSTASAGSGPSPSLWRTWQDPRPETPEHWWWMIQMIQQGLPFLFASKFVNISYSSISLREFMLAACGLETIMYLVIIFFSSTM